jgi:hypothetical protein
MFSPEDRNRAGFQNTVCRCIVICVVWFCVCVGLLFCGLYFGLFGVFSSLSIFFFFETPDDG